MVSFGKTFKTGLVATLLLAGFTSGARGQVAVGGGGSSFGGESRGVIQLTGKFLCTGCSLEEVSKAQPTQHHLYQLTNRRGQLVMEVQMINDSQRWSALTWPPRLWVRANEQILQKLGAEENLFKEVELTGLLNNSRTLDVFDLTVKAVSLSVLGTQLPIEGERQREEKQEPQHYFYQETAYGKFARTIPLPEAVDAEKIKANDKDGVLEITVPAPKDIAAKNIAIEAK